MKTKIFMLFTFIVILCSSSFAIMYVNEPKLLMTKKEISDCIKGRVVYDFSIVNGYPTDMKIISSEPNDYYTKRVVEWWHKHVSWSKKISTYDNYYSNIPVGVRMKSAATFDPCPDE